MRLRCASWMQAHGCRRQQALSALSTVTADVTSSANKQGPAEAAAFAEAYASSDLRSRNEAAIEALAAATASEEAARAASRVNSHRRPSMAASLASTSARHLQRLVGLKKQGTATPWWWGLFVLFRYRSGGCAPSSTHRSVLVARHAAPSLPRHHRPPCLPPCQALIWPQAGRTLRTACSRAEPLTPGAPGCLPRRPRLCAEGLASAAHHLPLHPRLPAGHRLLVGGR